MPPIIAQSAPGLIAGVRGLRLRSSVDAVFVAADYALRRF
jgi:hypothetical protein